MSCRTTVGKSREVCLQTGELLWTQIELCRAQRFQVFAFTNVVSIFVPRACEACSFPEDYPQRLTTNGHELTRTFSRAERTLECGGLTPLFFSARVRTMSER